MYTYSNELWPLEESIRLQPSGGWEGHDDEHKGKDN